MTIHQIMRCAQGTELADLLGIARTLHARQQAWEAWVGKEARGHMHLLDWQDGTLWVGVSSGTWAQWLRLRRDELLAHWTQSYPDSPVTALRCRVQPRLATLLRQTPASQNKRPANGPASSPEAAAALRVAALMVEDPQLAGAMDRLARTLEGKLRY